MVRFLIIINFQKINYSREEKEEKVERVAKPQVGKEPLNQSLQEQDFNSQLEEFIEF